MERGWPRGLERQLCYGGDYNPEQWPAEVWDEDIALMRQAGVNLVSLGVFAWSLLEPREGEYEFGWLDDVMGRLHRGGIAVALATPTASPPPWFSAAHPDALPVTADGTRLSHGSRDTYCACAPAYRAAALGVATALARRYRDHPALALWHIHNEYGTSCRCDHVAAAFRGWLRDRHGSLDRLNEAWTTAFWGQVYHDWAHVLPPRATQYLANPAQMLDFRRFWSDELLACFREQRDAVRELTPDVPVTTNLVLGAWVPVDQWSWAPEVDLIAIDHYPSASATAPEETAFAADLARGWAGGRPWLLMEQAPNLIYTPGRMRAKKPGLMTRLSLSHVARGARGVMAFQWRASRGGAEVFHSAMVPHAGPTSRVFAEVCTLGAVLPRLTVDGPVVADVALIWDPQAWWALQGPGLPSDDLDYLSQARSVHAAAWRAGITVDIVAPGADLAGYRAVLAPSLFLISAATAASVRDYVTGGGVLAVWFFSGVVDSDVRVWPGGYPGPLADVLGLRVEEVHPVAPGEQVGLSDGAVGSQWMELVRLHGASAEARYADGPLAGESAVSRHDVGAGRAYYVSTQLDEKSLDAFVRRICGAPPAPPPGVEVVCRADGSRFVLNHSDQAVTVAASGFDLVAAVPVTDQVRVPPGGVAVIVQSAPPASSR